MKNWIRTDDVLPWSTETEQVRGVHIEVGVSPYDLPRAVRGYYSDERERFVIEFQYLDEGEKSRTIIRKAIRLKVGRHSGRLHGVEIDVNSLGASQVSLGIVLQRVDESLESMTDARPGISRSNCAAVKNVLDSKSEEVFADLGVG